MLPVDLIADAFIQKSINPENPEESDLLCPMRLQKLLYYSQGWSLALRDRPLFDAEIEAWKHGPIISSIYRRFQHLGSQGILPESEAKGINGSRTMVLIVDMIWQHYGKFSASRLRAMTLAELPWRTARTGVPADAVTAVPISHDSMKSFFRQESIRRAGTILDPRVVWQIEEKAESESTISSEELFGELIPS